jgi:DoxX-like family
MKPQSILQSRAGWSLTVLVVVALLLDGGIDLVSPQTMHAAMLETGFPETLATPLGAIIVLCAILYVVPRTAVLGAILVTAFLGGAVCAHFRLGELGSPPQFISLLLGVMTWAGLCLRDSRLRVFLPLVSAPPRI